jgi:hypothetical protein
MGLLAVGVPGLRHLTSGWVRGTASRPHPRPQPCHTPSSSAASAVPSTRARTFAQHPVEYLRGGLDHRIDRVDDAQRGAAKDTSLITRRSGSRTPLLKSASITPTLNATVSLAVVRPQTGSRVPVATAAGNLDDDPIG